jgi:type IV pilus assembly protein PilM
MARSVIGLEIAEEGIRAAEVSVGKTPTLLAAGAVPLPEGAAKDSEILDAPAVALALTQLWAQGGFSSRRVVLGVANRRILVREYVSPRLEPSVLKESLPFAVQDLLPVPLEQAILDFLPTRETEDEVAGLLVATVAEGVEGLISTLALAKLRASAVEFIPFGLVRALNAAIGVQPEPVAVASVGEHTTSVVIVESGIPSFVRIVPLDLAPEVAQAPVEGDLALAGASARRAMSGASRPPVADAAYADLTSRLRNTLDFHAGREGATPVRTLFLTGSMATRETGSAVVGELRMDVRPLDVGDALQVSKDVGAKGAPPPSLLNAIGVALRGRFA